INSTTLFKEDKRIFIKNLFGNKGMNSLGKIIHIRETSCFISYHNNGLMAVYKQKIMLRNNGGSMYHYRIKTKNWNEKGIRIKGTNSVFFGST
ncbi:MAG: hypothetical protein K9J84_07045, partial [Bacteroidia bacterium]|nr:hypothetical protein [Bacteroidia bacterium]